MIPNRPVVLKDKAAKDFEKYLKRTPTKKEVDYCKKADELYSSNPLE
jgi:hypothetical protein